MTKQEVLKQYFGYDSFREGQEFLIDNILANNDVLGVMPTGAGKSICFQTPAMLLDGITIVISPLISLMKDQVKSLTQVGIRAAFLNSSLTANQFNTALNNAKKGEYKIIYVAPERLLSEDFLDFALQVPISMITIDEAHCISQWGQDFRPSYTRIVDFIALLPTRPIVSAFTATATKQVRDDIIVALKLEEAKLLITGFDRKNLYFEVQRPSDKMAALLTILEKRVGKTGIVYCSTRKAVEEVCNRLNQSSYTATRYHAGLSDNERHQSQDDFIFDKAQIMVATNAFGMGIDKSNVSFVVHYNMPKNIESYYQEAGRAGRDGEPADCILLYNGQDVRTNLFFIENSQDVQYPDPQTELLVKERDRQRLKEMTFYCHTNDCLREYTLRYFGEKTKNFCSNCSNCNHNFTTIDITVDAQKILSCVVRMKERYGVQLLIDVLRGGKTEKIRRLGLDKLSTYATSELSAKKLRDTINFLDLNEYLQITSDEYPIVKLGSRAKEILYQNQRLEMKQAQDYEKAPKTSKKTATVSSAALSTVDEELIKRLKLLRFELASAQRVPAFLIFSDSTLTDMCVKLPETEEALLGVSGVGAMKLERYGKRFLEEINKYKESNLSSENPSIPSTDDDEYIYSDEDAPEIIC